MENLYRSVSSRERMIIGYPAGKEGARAVRDYPRAPRWNASLGTFPRAGKMKTPVARGVATGVLSGRPQQRGGETEAAPDGAVFCPISFRLTAIRVVSAVGRDIVQEGI